MYIRWTGIDRYISRRIGYFTEAEIPKRLRWYVFKLVGTFQGVAWNDYRPDIEAYKTFNEFFSAPLAVVRPIYDCSMVSPVDAVICAQGKVEEGKIHQVKGVTFKLESFLGFTPVLKETSWWYPWSKKTDLYYVVLYLHPRDYHRFHSPTDAVFYHCRHFPGALLPVKMNVLKGYPGLFCINERVVMSGR